MKLELSAGFIIFEKENDNIKYLLLHYSSGHWDFPKGKLEHGETKHEAAVRELQEETGLTCKIIDGFERKFSYIFKNKSDEIVSKEVTLFLGQTDTQDVKISHEHIDYKWLEFNQAFNKVTFANARQALKAANEFLNPK
jgi:bis(5'-nucleosidyl)-tetraphosphatase